MVKTNYAAWHINPKEFDAAWPDARKLEFFARYAVLAPSGHNTQPWKLVVSKDSLSMLLNRDHYLSIDGSGLPSVEPYISLGTFLEVFVLAAQGFGYSLKLQMNTNKDKVAVIRLDKQIKPEPELLKAIVHRVSNRHPFDKKAVQPQQLKKLVSVQLNGVATTVLSTRADIDFIAKETEFGITTIMGNPVYRQELSLWVRVNHTRKFDGMPGFTHGFGNFKSLLSKAAIKHAPAGGPQAKKSGDLIRHSGALVIVRCKNDSQEAFINAGRIYSQICIFAQREGLATSALGASVLDPTTRDNVKKHFKITDRPVYLLRIGKTKAVPGHSPRWPLEKLLSRADV